MKAVIEDVNRYSFSINHTKRQAERAAKNYLIKSKSIAIANKENIRKKKINQLRRELDRDKRETRLQKEQDKLTKMTESQRFLYQTKKEINKRKRTLIARHKREYLRFIKKQAYKYKDMQNPEYKKFNIYKMMGQVPLKRCSDNMVASQAWDMLINSWTGFRINHAHNHKEGYIYYGQGIQRAVYLLELPPMRDFEQYLGLRPYTFKDELEL